MPAEDIWKGVTSVSNAGKKRGRGKGVKGRAQKLNRGQIIGVGKLLQKKKCHSFEHLVNT